MRGAGASKGSRAQCREGTRLWQPEGHKGRLRSCRPSPRPLLASPKLLHPFAAAAAGALRYASASLAPRAQRAPASLAGPPPPPATALPARSPRSPGEPLLHTAAPAESPSPRGPRGVGRLRRQTRGRRQERAACQPGRSPVGWSPRALSRPLTPHQNPLVASQKRAEAAATGSSAGWRRRPRGRRRAGASSPRTASRPPSLPPPPPRPPQRPRMDGGQRACRCRRSLAETHPCLSPRERTQRAGSQARTETAHAQTAPPGPSACTPPDGGSRVPATTRSSPCARQGAHKRRVPAKRGSRRS
jgi:hypothetical protein